MSDLEFYNKQDKEELVSMCIARDNKINSLKQEVNFYKDLSNTANNELTLLQHKLINSQQENKQLKEDFAVLKKLQMISNDILNELEEWLKSIPKYFMDKRSFNNGVYIEQGMQKQIDLTLDKIQKLKEKYK